MKVILLQDVKGTGKKGDIKEVAEGYGRNYLLPRKMAVEASGGNMNSLKEQQRLDAERKKQELAEATALGEKIEAKVLQIEAKAGKDGRLFGAITSKQISQAFRNTFQIEIDKKKITLKEPIKQAGFVKIPVKLHPKVTTTLTVQVIVVEGK
ncbi:50S ribosomal protein L9 [Shimazuella alba]|jgi:large subunit ribosomal protein L9|uniref:Large ribosomal subunit protein bL9 n=1 Tax=Shimazuella alba TaxID=2690964 RepID=A0A6I4VN60_9BACL|nr:50S ribosomal protein L9 [Shimazuella alba]MXQ53059.1 50S ribosomal protein L9 [Shimazuella alba]